MEKIKLGFGTFPLKENLMELIPFVDKCGYTLIDTSDDYYNEIYISKVACHTNLKIFTKFSIIKGDPSFEIKFKTIQKLYKDNNCKIYCYLMHWPYPFIYKKIWKKMEDLYLNGEVDQIGVCNFSVDKLEKLQKKCRVKPAYNEIELHPLFQQSDITAYCKNNDIQIISYSPFARMDSELFNNDIMKQIAKKHNTSIVNIILKWNIDKGFIPIPSTSKFQHIEEMSIEHLSSINLTIEEIGLIDSLEKGKRIRFNPQNYFSIKTKVKFFVKSIFMR